LSAAAVGAVAAEVVPVVVVAMVLAGAIVVYAMAEAFGLPLWRPQAQRQVPEAFRRTRYVRTTAFLWGLDLGVGWTTKQATAALLMLTLGMCAVAPETAILGGVVFGLTRGSTILLALGAKTRQEVESRFDAVRHRVGVARIGTVVSAAVLASALLYTI
jgi:hypothetical protein